MERDDSIVELPTEGRPPAVLQVIPSLVSGGAERGTIDLAGALAASGWTAYVASSGGPMENQLARVGARHLKLPLASKNPLVMRRNVAALTEIIRRHKRAREIYRAAFGPARDEARDDLQHRRRAAFCRQIHDAIVAFHSLAVTLRCPHPHRVRRL